MEFDRNDGIKVKRTTRYLSFHLIRIVTSNIEMRAKPPCIVLYQDNQEKKTAVIKKSPTQIMEVLQISVQAIVQGKKRNSLKERRRR